MIMVRNASGRITDEKKVVEQDYCAKLYLSQCLFWKSESQNKEKRLQGEGKNKTSNAFTTSLQESENKRMTLNATAVQLVLIITWAAIHNQPNGKRMLFEIQRFFSHNFGAETFRHSYCGFFPFPVKCQNWGRESRHRLLRGGPSSRKRPKQKTRMIIKPSLA